MTAPAKTSTQARAGGRLGSATPKLVGVAVLLGLLAGVAALSLAIGSGSAGAGHIWGALTSFDGSNEHIIIREMRLPRTLIGLTAGAALGAAGGLMQAITRNPLAEPGILGDRKSTRLNSSHVAISYAVFCLKKQ